MRAGSAARPGRSEFLRDPTRRWDAAAGEIRFTYWSDSGLFGEAEGIVDGDVIRFGRARAAGLPGRVRSPKSKMTAPV
jgi:hypothetical protein